MLQTLSAMKQAAGQAHSRLLAQGTASQPQYCTPLQHIQQQKTTLPRPQSIRLQKLGPNQLKPNLIGEARCSQISRINVVRGRNAHMSSLVVLRSMSLVLCSFAEGERGCEDVVELVGVWVDNDSGVNSCEEAQDEGKQPRWSIAMQSISCRTGAFAYFSPQPPTANYKLS